MKFLIPHCVLPCYPIPFGGR
ncbi:hypothetical protein PHET_12277 [Paragonimus heterotremus]|uniref:Uncharacterized protein n=1 Tax=Paragonimus heterotremus TaxID=100268 RepID=A0A8J4T0C8_9TREM|nr:hypothetical protein PHET_12277 [Paragonimus heterotremus]